MTIACDLNEVLRRSSRVVYFLPELEGQNWILCAMNYEDWCAYSLKIRLCVKLRANE